jgi:hypothetical protein
MRLCLVFLALSGFMVSCEMSAATSKAGVGDSGAAGGSGSDGDGGGGEADADADTDADTDSDTIDADADGYTPENGDCDDDDEGVHPGAVDRCDGIDSDCDEEIDEDADLDDAYEPNDAVAYDLGTIEGDGSVEVYAFLDAFGDEDRFAFDFTDGTFDFFTLRVTLAPQHEQVFFQMTVQSLETGEITTASTDGDEDIVYEEGDALFSADGGEYIVTITSNGTATCLDEYKLTVELDSLF